jgi:hypothetical protein
MPRAAILSIHARVAETTPDILDDPSLVQLWGPRFSAFVVSEPDRAFFTLGRWPDDARGQSVAEEMATRLDQFLDGRHMGYGEAGEALGVNPNRLRYGAPTGRIVMRWDGARQPTVWTVPAPGIEPAEARLELGRRYLHVFGPATSDGFARWAGISPASGRAAFDALKPEIVAVRTPVGEGSILATDEMTFRAPATSSDGARLLPSGDAYWLFWGRDRELLVPDANRQAILWTSRVWPGALLLGGEIVGVWRRANARLTIEPWRRLTVPERSAVEAEALSLPLPGLRSPISVAWSG